MCQHYYDSRRSISWELVGHFHPKFCLKKLLALNTFCHISEKLTCPDAESTKISRLSRANTRFMLFTAFFLELTGFLDPGWTRPYLPSILFNISIPYQWLEQPVNILARLTNYFVSYSIVRIIVMNLWMSNFFTILICIYCLYSTFKEFMEIVSEDGRNSLNDLSIYREVQLLSQIYNVTHRKVLSVVVTFWLSMFCLNGSTFMAYRQYLTGPIIVGSTMQWLNALLVLTFAHNFPRKIYDVSEDIGKDTVWSKVGEIRGNGITRKLMKRYTKSFPVQKIYVFENSFYNKSTTIAYLDF